MFMRLDTTLKKRARSSSSHYRDINDGLFTKPVRLGKKAVGWPVEEVNALNTARMAGLTDNEIQELVKELHARRNKDTYRVIAVNGVGESPHSVEHSEVSSAKCLERFYGDKCESFGLCDENLLLWPKERTNAMRMNFCQNLTQVVSV